MKLAEKEISKLKEENPLETAVDFVGEGVKYKKTKGQDNKKGNKRNQ